jgi:hypothetical protein
MASVDPLAPDPEPPDADDPLQEAVREAVNAHDPQGLLALGAPPHEYDPEVRALTHALRRGRPATRGLVLDVMSRWSGTGEPPDESAAEGLARRLRGIVAHRED